MAPRAPGPLPRASLAARSCRGRSAVPGRRSARARRPRRPSRGSRSLLHAQPRAGDQGQAVHRADRGDPGCHGVRLRLADPGHLHARAGAARHQRRARARDRPSTTGTCRAGSRSCRAAPAGGSAHWPEIVDRADTPPADIVPGHARPVGPRRRRSRRLCRGSQRPEPGGDRGRRPRRSRRSGLGRLAHGRRNASGRARGEAQACMVVRLPAGAVGQNAIDAVLAARRAPDLVFVVQGPSALRRSLLAAGAAGLTGGRNLRSASTRTDGLVLTTDFAPTVLERLGLTVPDRGRRPADRGKREPQRRASCRRFRKRLGDGRPPSLERRRAAAWRSACC